MGWWGVDAPGCADRCDECVVEEVGEGGCGPVGALSEPEGEDDAGEGVESGGGCVVGECCGLGCEWDPVGCWWHVDLAVRCGPGGRCGATSSRGQ